MKLFIAALALPAMVAGYTIGGFDMFGRPVFVSPRARERVGRGCSPQQNSNMGRQVDRAFEELRSELNGDRYRRRQSGPNRGPVNQNLKMDQETIRQQQEWVNRAFGLAADVAKGMASSPREVKEANEALRQQQEWVNSIFGFASDVATGGGSPTFVRSEITRDDKEMFQVALDLPGVKRSDIDITVEGDSLKNLSVRGKREIGNVDDGVSHSKKFSKTFALDASVDLDQISATLDSGVLLISVPRNRKDTAEYTQKVEVQQVADESVINTEDGDEAFQLELDVPGVVASNIDITMQSDDLKTLIVNAKREVGKESDGSPRFKEMTKQFKVDEVVDTEKIIATLNNGVLRISAPKDQTKVEAKIKKIPIDPQIRSDGLGIDDSEENN